MKLSSSFWLGLSAISLVTVSGGADTAKKSYSAGHFALTIDGQPALARSIDGGSVKTEGTASVQIEIDRNGSEPIWSWLQADWGQSPKNVVVPLAKKRRMDWTIGHVTRIKFPKLSASEKKTSASLILVVNGDSGSVKPGALTSGGKTKQKAWVASNFRLEIDGMPTKGVSKIDSFSIKVKTENKIEVDPIRVTLDVADAGAWKSAQKQKSKKNGSIQLTEADGTSVWKTIDLGGVRVTAWNAGVATLSVEKISLH